MFYILGRYILIALFYVFYKDIELVYRIVILVVFLLQKPVTLRGGVTTNLHQKSRKLPRPPCSNY